VFGVFLTAWAERLEFIKGDPAGAGPFHLTHSHERLVHNPQRSAARRTPTSKIVEYGGYVVPSEL